MHADGHAFAPGLPDAQAARARAWAPGSGRRAARALKLADYPPPWEIETSFIAPDDSIPWNYWMNFIVLDKQGKNLGMWTPGVENDPKAKRHRPFPGATFKRPLSARSARVDPGAQAAGDADPVPRRLARPARLPRRAERPLVPLRDLSTSKADLGTEIGAFGMHCWSTTTGRMYGAGPGGPMYQKFLIDYVRYRYGLSTAPGNGGSRPMIMLLVCTGRRVLGGRCARRLHHDRVILKEDLSSPPARRERSGSLSLRPSPRERR